MGSRPQTGGQSPQVLLEKTVEIRKDTASAENPQHCAPRQAGLRPTGDGLLSHLLRLRQPLINNFFREGWWG